LLAVVVEVETNKIFQDNQVDLVVEEQEVDVEQLLQEQLTLVVAEVDLVKIMEVLLVDLEDLEPL
jgi:hypothetical protein|tara:strand:- start:199 stop:393 length:195 start_codon:yes stop_codon:yes gene_type:complete